MKASQHCAQPNVSKFNRLGSQKRIKFVFIGESFIPVILVSDVTHGPLVTPFVINEVKEIFRKYFQALKYIDEVLNFSLIFMPPRSKIRGHIVFVLSVILSETLTLLITSEWYVLGF